MMKYHSHCPRASCKTHKKVLFSVSIWPIDSPCPVAFPFVWFKRNRSDPRDLRTDPGVLVHFSVVSCFFFSCSPLPSFLKRGSSCLLYIFSGHEPRGKCYLLFPEHLIGEMMRVLPKRGLGGGKWHNNLVDVVGV